MPEANLSPRKRQVLELMRNTQSDDEQRLAPLLNVLPHTAAGYIREVKAEVPNWRDSTSEGRYPPRATKLERHSRKVSVEFVDVAEYLELSETEELYIYRSGETEWKLRFSCGAENRISPDDLIELGNHMTQMAVTIDPPSDFTQFA